MTVDVGKCVDIESPEERFACYEAQVDAATSDEAKARAVSAGRVADPTPAAEASASSAGVRSAAGTAPASEAAPASQAAHAAGTAPPVETVPAGGAVSAAEAGEIVGRIDSLHETVPNAYLITLEDGQVWRQTYPKRYFLRAGDDVRIYPSNWGTDHRLTVVGRSGYIQVEKVR